MKLPQYIDMVRLDLHDLDSTRFTEDQITRGLQRAINDLNRWIPRERIHEFRVVGGTITETVDVGTKPSTVQLTNRLIRSGSVVISGSTLDTDFGMDYANGIINFPADSNINDDASVEVTYSMANIAIDLTDIEDFVSVGMIEYLVGQIPQSEATWRNWGNFLYITTQDIRSQVPLTANSHLALYYFALHEQPSAIADGTIPENLAEVVAKGAGAYLLLAEAIDLEFQSADEQAQAIAQLASVSAAQTAIDSALTLAATQLGLALTILATINAELMGLSDSAVADLGLITGIFVQVDADLATVLDLESTALGFLSSANGWFTGAPFSTAESKISTFESRAGDAQNDIGGTEHDLVTAENRLVRSDVLINAVNVGLDPASRWIESANIMTGIAHETGLQADRRIQLALGWIQAAAQWLNDIQARISIGQARIQSASIIPQLENQHSQVAVTRLEKARILAERATARTNIANALAKLSDSYVQACLGYIQIAAQRVAEVQQDVQVAAGYLEVVRVTADLALKFREEGTLRLTEFQSILQDRNQVRRDRSIVPARQPR